ncbi:MAG: thiol-disulfide isomerase [Acidobacteria bacterium]|nr:thiol-disulfide isomerase [Acidobacteriota bacterium]
MKLAAIISLSATALLAAAEKPTYNKDVEPIMMNRCQECHRAGEIGPMPLMSYQDVRPWAKAIKASVSTKKMPPWFADPAHGKFSNDRSMSQTEIDTITAWVDAGAPEGDKKDKRAARTFVDGWNIPTPDLVVGMPKAFPVPANSKIDYQYLIIPTGLKEDKWVNMVEARPSDRSVVHHIVIFIRDPKSKWLREAEPGVAFVPNRTGKDRRIDVGGGGNEILHIYTPGNLPDVWKPTQAKLIPAGSDLVMQMHYTSTKKDTADQTRVGMVFSKQAPEERIMTLTAGNDGFSIPPGDDNHRVPGSWTFRNDATLMSFFPHMHLRGKAFEMNLITEGGKETVLKVNKYDFNWQLTYKLEKPMVMKPGMKLEAVGYFDNSPNNPYNPDPKATVIWGEQSWEEMMYGFFDVAIDARHDRSSWFQRKQLPPKTEE